MKKVYCFIIITAILLSFTGCSKPDTASKAGTDPSSPASTASPADVPKEDTVEKEYSISLKLSSKSIAKNIVNENSEREVLVQLPPSYYDSDKKYPVVYFMPGYGEDTDMYMGIFSNALAKEFEAGKKEFIIVGVDGRNQLGGSFYANSPVSGNWEDYVIDDVVPLVDGELRTLANRDSRGICGFSMGGYAAYNLPLKHPDVFSSCIAMSPGVMADGDLKAALATWDNDADFKKSYAQAFSPNAENTTDFGNTPTFSGTPEDNKIIADWENGYGNVNKKLDDYLALKTPLKAIKLIYGENDSYPWIPKGSEFMAAAMTKKGIANTIEKLPLGHTIPLDLVDKYLVPFFNENLVY